MNAEAPAAPRRIACRCLISGRVQGVYYRASARERARGAGILGHAHNLPDGSVEVLAYGEEAAVLAFIDWLWIGSSTAKVSAVSVQALELAPHELPREFRTG